MFAEDSPKRNGLHNGDSPGNGLVHVNKSRPAPPRKFKHVGSTTPSSNGLQVDNHMSSSMHSSLSSSATPPSPRLRTTVSQQINQLEDPPEPSMAPSLPTSTPPPLVPRRNIRLPMPNQPPLLPPKPSTQSPTELRNHKTLVLPALDAARELYKDESDDSS
jgi:hypothetical protein